MKFDACFLRKSQKEPHDRLSPQHRRSSSQPGNSLPPNLPSTQVPSRHNGIKHAPRSILPSTTRRAEHTSTSRRGCLGCGAGWRFVSSSWLVLEPEMAGRNGRSAALLSRPLPPLGTTRHLEEGNESSSSGNHLGGHLDCKCVVIVGGLHVLLESPCSQLPPDSRGKKEERSATGEEARANFVGWTWRCACAPILAPPANANAQSGEITWEENGGSSSLDVDSSCFSLSSA